MKIHEQEWKQGKNRWSIRDAQTGAERARVSTDDQTADEADAVSDLVVTAPKMARALLAHGRFAVEPNGDTMAWHTHACWATNRAVCLDECSRDRDALISAGVL